LPVRSTSTQIPGIPNLQAHWGNVVANTEPVAILSLIIALLVLLFREQARLLSGIQFATFNFSIPTAMRRTPVRRWIRLAN
jgi:hypothetical protein